MQLKIAPVTENFAAEASGLDLRRPIDAETAAEIEEAMDKYAVLVWRDQPLDDDQHMAFTKWFGPLDMGLLNVTKKPNRFKHAGFVDIANVGIDGEIMARDHGTVTSSMANQFWHTDSSFMETVAKYSLLSARVVPETGGDTEFTDMRAAWDALPDDLRTMVTGLVGEHHPLYSRILLGNTYSDEQMAGIPPAHWPLVRTHPGSGRTYLFTPIHVHRIEGMSMAEARVLVNELIEHATQPQFVHRHTWQAGDLLMWDNRCTLHRGRRFDYTQRRDLRRTTTMEDPAGA
ncbi:MAG: TauD/TfdA family dioxygenase [Rhodospirillaceae bacterium]|nr:MAG: TauD/TfdA family dioxygenase [Rhodospirillaceae bacterium]